MPCLQIDETPKIKALFLIDFDKLYVLCNTDIFVFYSHCHVFSGKYFVIVTPVLDTFKHLL